MASSPFLWESFLRVWGILNPNESLPAVPELRQWLSHNVALMKGNYRDLNKIATRWQFYRRFKLNDEEVFNHLKTEFIEFGYGAQPHQQTGSYSYALEDGLDKLEREFRYQVCVEARRLYPTQKKAADALKTSLKTINRILSGETRETKPHSAS